MDRSEEVLRHLAILRNAVGKAILILDYDKTKTKNSGLWSAREALAEALDKICFPDAEARR